MSRPTKKRESLRKLASVQASRKMADELKEEARLGIKYLYYTFMETGIALDLTTEVITSIHRFLEFVCLEHGTSRQLIMRHQVVTILRRLYPIPGENEEIRTPNIGDEQVIAEQERRVLDIFINSRAREFGIYPRLVAKLLVHESPSQSDEDNKLL